MTWERLLPLLNAGVLVALGVIAVLLKWYLPSYLTEKAKNLATKDDIGNITREVEKVRSEHRERFEALAQQNRLLLEREKQRHELRLAALDRRLAAHQEAYALWWNLLHSVHKEAEIGKAVINCQEWWIHNRLYLEPEVAQAFSLAYHAAAQHADYLQAKLPRPEIEENWRTIRVVGEVIVKAVQLPSLQEGEYRPVGDEGRGSGGGPATGPASGMQPTACGLG